MSSIAIVHHPLPGINAVLHSKSDPLLTSEADFPGESNSKYLIITEKIAPEKKPKTKCKH